MAELYRLVSKHPSRPVMYLDVGAAVWVYSVALSAHMPKQEAEERLNLARSKDPHKGTTYELELVP